LPLFQCSITCRPSWISRRGFRVSPAPGAFDPDLAPADRLAQADQHAQLIRDPFHPRALVDDRLAPVGLDHAGDRHPVGRVVEVDPLTVRVASEQYECLHQRPVGGVVAAKPKRPEHGREHPAVVAPVGGAKHLAHPRPESLIVGLRLADQLAQRLLADHRPDRPTHRVIGMIHSGLREREQDPALAAHVFEVGQPLLLDPVVRARVHLVHDAHQQVHEAVGDLARARGAEARE
jgi:hypothetical protein